MKIITDMVQGSDAWHAHRAEHFNASDAPAMMGCSQYSSRQDLLRELATGIKPAINATTQSIFDKGHLFEALARPMAEDIIGAALSPCVGYEGKLSASFDGITITDDVIFEHKTLNKDLLEIMSQEGFTGNGLPLQYRVQMEQQLYLSGADKCLFMASKWEPVDEITNYFVIVDGEKQYYEPTEERHCWYEPDIDLLQSILRGWAQFEIDLAGYQQTEIKEMPAAEVTIDLPALFVHAKGEITTHNMDEFGKALAVSLAETRAIVLITDQDFSNAKAAAKKFRETAKAIAASKEQMLAQTETIGEAARKMDAWAKDLNATALQLEKDVEKEDRKKKEAMILVGKNTYAEHIVALEARISPIRLITTPPSFADAIKGLRNYASMQNAIDTMLANAKIAANEVADRIDANLKHFHIVAWDSKALFPDLQAIATKQPDDFAAVVKMRIQEHAAAEQAKAEALREQIRQEEEAKARAEAENKVRAEMAVKAVQNPVEQPATAPAADTWDASKGDTFIPAAVDELMSGQPSPAKTKRPTDKQIIFAVATQFGVDFHIASKWIKEIDFSDLRGAA